MSSGLGVAVVVLFVLGVGALLSFLVSTTTTNQVKFEDLFADFAIVTSLVATVIILFSLVLVVT